MEIEGGKNAVAVSCPVCAGEFEVKKALEMGEILPCPHCGGNLEVLSVLPLKLGQAPLIVEDWGE
ncbi:MAG: lysine biosynthesis protein LysW [Candidatus Micrarchaeota archaeon]